MIEIFFSSTVPNTLQIWAFLLLLGFWLVSFVSFHLLVGVCLFCGAFCCFFSSKKDQVRALGDGERLFLTLVETVVREESVRGCGRKQRKESGLWEAAAPAGRAPGRSETKGKRRQRCAGQSFPGQRPLWRVHCSS